ncbi:flagellar filament capping protein FliD [Erythrobacter dokdonensis]|uniref:Flagellar hook-associated protein 2 n=1 Tax=Erythrobacter dokdonensis DSW-74 TaxID=1300349 RepID=A0A1A7BI69_9SPHN|nr:flagellar filament capping protein FliD [Erythrobacter dokdonensis]OBV10895.1 Flagellar hook-associated protein 2 [Erythrobacter dokdonensis DSW-74]
MENPGSSIISALGAGSGVDFIRLADDISTASFAFQRETVQARRETLEAQISAAGQLRGAITSLASALGDRIRNGDLAPRGELGNPAIARVSVPAGLSPRGTFALEVTQLAQGQTLVGRSYASREDLVGAGTLTLRFGTVDGASFTADAARDPLEITVSADDTLASLAARITRESGGAVSAYVATGTNGAQLVMKGAEGAASGFVVEATGAGGGAVPGDLSYLGWSPATDAGELRGIARDAAFALDTVAMTSPTNRVTGLPGGFTLNLAGTNQGAPTSLTFANNIEAISGVMGDFVAALNDIAEQSSVLASPLGGTLGNDPGARELRRDLAALAGQIVMPGAAAGEPRTLADIGLALNRDGTFRLDTARLNQALESSPDAVAAMFTTGPSGVFATIDRFARENSLASDPGSIGGSVRRFEAQLERSDERLERIAEQQEALRERLTRDLVAAERRVAASQSTLTFIQQQVDIWSADR